MNRADPYREIGSALVVLENASSAEDKALDA